MLGLYKFAQPLLFKIDAETAHGLMLRAMKMGALPSCGTVSSPKLEQTVFGLKFANPVGLAAGFDKNAEVINPILKMGFGFTEVGTVTPKPQEGNTKPRIFRDPKNEAVINRMGFPNLGLSVFKQNLQRIRHRPGIIGINIGMNKDQTDAASDYAFLIQELAPLADYMTVNISSPNTPGLRNLQQKDNLSALLSQLMSIRGKTPLLVKLAPDLTEEQQEEIAGVLIESSVDGVILCNTTLDRPDFLSDGFREEKGGLSGQPVRSKSTAVIHNFYHLTKGKLPIIGVGGISSGAHAYEKIKAGASLVQLYTGLVYEGPAVANSINNQLLALLEKDGLSNIAQAVGKAH